MSRTIQITCPHCKAALEVDVEAGVVLGHHPPKEEKKTLDFDQRLRQLEEEKRRAAGKLEEAMRHEKAKERVLEERFRKLMEEAPGEDQAGPPLKDIDLD